MTVMMTSGTMPCGTVWAPRNHLPTPITASSPMRFIQCRAGNRSGLPPIFPDNLPNAMTDPENVTAPMRMPM